MTNFENELVKSLKDKLQNNHWDLSEDNSFVRMAKEVSKDMDYFVKNEDEEDDVDINKADLINLSGQVINGIMSSDDSLWVKLFDRTDHKQVAGIAVDIAYEMLKEINKKIKINWNKIKKGLTKVWQWDKKLKNGTIMSFIRCELFNPFAKIPPEVILPKFEIIPRIGLGIRRDIREGKFESFYIIVGWLNFYIEFNINYWRIIKL